MITDTELMDRARGVAELAYSPYSSAKVGCALVTEAGRVYLGCNVENASYGLTMCAERVAVGRAVAEEGAGMRWVRAAVVALGLEFPPCGACRQVLAEFAMADSRVIFLSQGELVSMGMSELLPAGFALADLNG
jgi:cytidine deaminase